MALVVLGSVVLLAAASASASAQPAAVASLSPVEGGRWEASSASPIEGGRVCLEPGGYVAAVRVEPGFLGVFGMDVDGGPFAPSVAAVVIGENDGRRESWDLFPVSGIGTRCFQVRAVVQGALTEGQYRRPALRAQIYLLRVGVDW